MNAHFQHLPPRAELLSEQLAAGERSLNCFAHKENSRIMLREAVNDYVLSSMRH